MNIGTSVTSELTPLLTECRFSLEYWHYENLTATCFAIRMKEAILVNPLLLLWHSGIEHEVAGSASTAAICTLQQCNEERHIYCTLGSVFTGP